jgi:membrane-associated phospholipid phosphatase
VENKYKKINPHKGHLIYGLVTIVLVVILYFFVDKSSCDFFNKVRHTNYYSTFFIMQNSVVIMVSLFPYAFIYLLVMLFIKRFLYFEQFILLVMISVFFSSTLANVLKAIFGRYWTETFVEDNLSLIRTKTYGYDFFRGDLEHSSFPSGHTTVIFAIMTVLWIMYPRWRWFSVVSCAVVVAGLLGCNFHFPSDIVAGAFIGIITAIFVLHTAQIYAKDN